MPVPGVLYLNLCPPHPPCSPLSPIRACCRKSFFPFSFFFIFSLSSEPVSCDIGVTSTSPHPHTGDIPSARHQPHRRHLDTATTAPTPWPLQPPPRHPLRARQPP